MGKIIKVTGKVQGVGFRPFVYREAIENLLCGIVRNESSGVYIEVEGKLENINRFIKSLKERPPTLSSIEVINIENVEDKEYKEFKVVHSDECYGVTPIMPDIGICEDCIEDIRNGRRKEYVFTNCTNCGPRYSIIKSLPYDRVSTTMDKFHMCNECRKEYENPLDRRFHAQPNCCKECGPSLKLMDKNMNILDGDEIEMTIDLLKKGNIICIKSLTGYNLICIPEDKAIKTLRRRKKRYGKPLAIMMKDITTIKKHCYISEEEKEALTSSKAPIVLLKKKGEGFKEASYNNSLGVILPYTPLHYRLFENGIESLIFTSGNTGGEPIVFEEENLESLRDISDYFLIHNRDINIGVDDSIVRVLDKPYIFRGGRGYYPRSIKGDFQNGILTLGSLMKNSISLTKEGYLFTSPYIGDIEKISGEKRLIKVYENLKKIYMFSPRVLAYDAHPYMEDIPFIRDFNGEKIRVFHHHAHIASCMAENNYFDNVIGIAFDGTGYGEGGGILGGEFIISSLKDFKRECSIKEFHLIGGEAAIISPYRVGISLINNSMENSRDIIDRIFEKKPDIEYLIRILNKGINSPKTSSIGRLFDGVASILGFQRDITYEGEAAIFLEDIALKGKDSKSYSYKIENEKNMVINIFPMIRDICTDLLSGEKIENIALRFHSTIIEFSCKACKIIRDKYSLNVVALSGGVFQNSIILKGLKEKLCENGFRVLTHRDIPCNDGGISIGQAYIVNELLR